MKLTLQQLAAKSIEVELKHPVTNVGLGVTVRIVGKNSRQFKDQFYQTVAQAQKDSKEAPSADRLKLAEQRSVDLIAACIVGWDDEEFFGGPYSQEKALEIIGQPELSWVKDQLEQAIVEDSSFFAS